MVLKEKNPSIEQYSLIPHDFRRQDPRMLAYHYPRSLNLVAYAKKMQVFSFYQALSVAEDLAHRQGFLLLPKCCINWKRAKDYGIDRRVKVGRNSFYMMQLSELTRSEKKKLENYILKEINKEVHIA